MGNRSKLSAVYPSDVSSEWISLVARVEWRSEHKAAQRPQAVIVASERREVEEEWRWVEGGQTAGGPLEAVWIVKDDEGRRYRLRCREGEDARVEIQCGPRGA
ncbi:MAG: hypothetical protein KA072_10835 [Thermoanaerobaculaceae bacterium]|nr:hypothetical protein [Thermoanaerobaculaceae bacterium]MDI9620695.1 hypothetical protein [Acidobacteriota bacterium]NLH10663.1 hypothetical protein [Holophagae bacterium]